MRAGAFGERRVIDLLNRRFVAFYFNTGGPGQGKDSAAAEFVKGKVKNKWAYLAAFTPEGAYISESEIYADKNEIFAYLVELLRTHPACNEMTAEEKKIDAPEALGRLHEELGDYVKARAAYEKAGTVASTLALARIARYEGDWKTAERLLATLKDGADVSMERGYRLIHEREYGDARALLEKAVRAHPGSSRLGEMRFNAGVACWFLKERAWANYHWCWVVENIPDDRLARRSYIAAAAEGMPYANPELGGYKIKAAGGSIEVIGAAYAAARKDYDRLKSEF